MEKLCRAHTHLLKGCKDNISKFKEIISYKYTTKTNKYYTKKKKIKATRIGSYYL